MNEANAGALWPLLAEQGDLEEAACLPDRLLLWLLKHPFQRAEDLSLALQVPRSSVYRHLHTLFAQRAVEQVRLSRELRHTQAWYHLTNAGLCRVAHLVGAVPEKLARMWGTQEAALLRHVPRLHASVLLQNVINGLLRTAPAMLAYPAGHPVAIRWHWLRDYQTRFSSKRRTCLSVHLDAVLVLARSPLEGRETEDACTPSEYATLLLLFDPGLDGNTDLSLIQARLTHLLRWRESQERWSHYHSFPPLLVLVGTDHQREVWQRCARDAAAQSRLAPLQGAIVAHAPWEEVSSSWTLPWSHLSSETPCQLQRLLPFVERAAVLPGILAPKAAPPGTFVRVAADAPSTSRQRRVITGHFQRRAAALTSSTSSEKTAPLLLGIQLSRRQVEIIRLLYAHPLLSLRELAVFSDLRESSMQVYLSQLRRLRCIQSRMTTRGRRFLLAERGLRFLAGLLGVSPFHLCEVLAPRTPQAARPLVQRGVWQVQRLMRHTAGLYGFLCQVAQAARTLGHELAWWETGARCARRYRFQGSWHNLRPDALVAYHSGEQTTHVWLEWDEGSMHARQLQHKLEAYAWFVRARQWDKEARVLPLLVFVVPDYEQEVRIGHVVQAILANIPLVVSATTASLLRQEGLLAPIWRPLLPVAQNVQATQRQSWSQLF